MYFVIVYQLCVITFQLAGMLRRLQSTNNEPLVLAFVNDIIDRFALSKKWHKRQM